MEYLRFLRTNYLFLLAGFLLTFTSSYGQTYFISLFAGKIMGDYGLSDGQWGLIYTIGTSLSAAAMIWAGALTDRFRVRALANWVMGGLALACLAMAVNSSPVILVAVIFTLRFTGQGMLSQLGAVAMSRWFVAARGKALSLSSMGFAAGQAVLPIVFVGMMVWADWRMLWVLAAALIVLSIPVMAMLLRQERTPQSMAQSDQSAGMLGRHWTRKEVLTSGLFWLMIPLVLGPSTWGTALFFQQVHLTEVKGWPLVSYVALMPVMIGVSVLFTFGAGWAIDRFGARRVVPVQMLPFAVSFAIMANATSIPMAGLALAIFGMGQGMQATATAAFWAEFYGTRHLGAIKAVGAAVMVFGSAIGPGITGALIDRGIDFPDQMTAIAVYFLIAAALTTAAMLRYQRDLRR
ncbi:MAG: MFS transporter [Sulfitobacter sp.]